jgi:hypothetical protein
MSGMPWHERKPENGLHRRCSAVPSATVATEPRGSFMGSEAVVKFGRDQAARLLRRQSSSQRIPSGSGPTSRARRDLPLRLGMARTTWVLRITDEACWNQLAQSNW